jgi:4-diphosphocytidyl-2C-methyl-D-erythritol kinase
VVPRIKVPTPLIYRKWDALFRQRPGLTRRGSDVKILTLALLKKGLLLGSHALYNSLQEVTTRLYPEINRIRENLKRLGVKSILMSGSGPAVFGIVSGKKEAQALSGKLRRINRSWKVFAVRTR